MCDFRKLDYIVNKNTGEKIYPEWPQKGLDTRIQHPTLDGKFCIENLYSLSYEGQKDTQGWPLGMYHIGASGCGQYYFDGNEFHSPYDKENSNYEFIFDGYINLLTDFKELI